MSWSAPQGLKPASFASLSGTAETMYIPKPFLTGIAEAVGISKPLMRQLLKLLVLMAAASCLLSHPTVASDKNKSRIPAVRWAEGNPGCTFSRDADGKYRYGLWSDEAGIVLAVDSQELEKVHRRHQPFFAVLLTVRYRGQTSLEVETENISLQFMKHFQVMQTALDPDDFSDKVQNDADTLNDETARQVEKHPEQKEQKEAFVRAFLKDSAELQEFVGKNSLRPTRLSPGKTEASGWVLFSTDSKWISRWKKQEEFILRVPLAGKVFEFPFRLPPKPGETILRKRE
jgi:hypothetical protein